MRRAVAHKAIRDHALNNPEVCKEMKVIYAVRCRLGFRRIGVLLERKEIIMNHKILHSICCEERLGVK